MSSLWTSVAPGSRNFKKLDCDDNFLVPLDQPLDRAKAGKIIAEVTHGCVERLRSSGIDLDAYNTRESAADLEALRQFLGADKLTLWGISYGTHLALPIRATAPTEFFYEGSTTRLSFQTNNKGEVTGMLMYADGTDEGVPATKFD